MTDDQSSGLMPSGSTNASAVGAFLAALIMWYLGQRKIFFPAGFEALLAGFLVTLIGYLPKSGRK